MRSIQMRGLLGGTDFEETTYSMAVGMLVTPYGRYLYRQDRNGYLPSRYPDIAQVFDEVLEFMPKGECRYAFRYQEYLIELDRGTL